MEPAHGELVWPTAKAYLYLLEAAHVKKAIGRERIHRNKDALKELRCLQEILSDLHAGQFGREPERRSAAEAAAKRWEELVAESQRRGLAPEALCEVPQRIRPLLITSRAACSPGSPKAGGISGSLLAGESTRAPSTVTGALEMDTDQQSLATEDAYSEVTSLKDEQVTSLIEDVLGPAGSRSDATFSDVEKKRRSRGQLDKLAEELREQLDQEYTSLMASIEEVQALMEAEVAGDAQLPSLEELKAFVAEVDHALEGLQTGHRQDKQLEPLRTLEVVHEEPRVALVEQQRQPEPLEERLELMPEMQIEGNKLEVAVAEQSMLEQIEQLEQLEEAQHVLRSSSQAPAQRPRWADICSDSEEAGALGSDADCSSYLWPARAPEAGQSSARAAMAQCSRCHRLLPRAAFSRRAWRQVRGLGSEGQRQPDSAICHDCNALSGRAPARRQESARPRRPAR